MAIFRDAEDQNLPRITRFYQVELPEGWQDDPDLLFESELDEFLYYDLPAKFIETMGTPPYISARWHGERWQHRELLKDIADFWWGLRYMMDTAVDGKEPEGNSLGVTQRFNELLKEYAAPLVYILHTEGRASVHFRFGGLDLTVSGMATELLSALQSNALARCEECNSVFARRRSARYCSRRCSNTAGERRRRKERLEKV